MPFYKAIYKTNADPDGRFWPLGEWPDRDAALAYFNKNEPQKEGVGPFTFEETSPFIPDHHLVEQEELSAPGVMFPLYKARAPLPLPHDMRLVQRAPADTGEDVANMVVRATAERHGRFVAATSSGNTAPINLQANNLTTAPPVLGQPTLSQRTRFAAEQ